MEHRPIFIGGLSFTGKTQLRMMLSAHPNILISRRTHLWDYFYNRYGDLSKKSNLDRCLKAIFDFKPMRVLHPNYELIRMEFSQGPATYERLFALLHAQNAKQKGKSRWGDQLGFVEYYADRIFAAYPSARMIHMVRDPGARAGESRMASSHKVGRIGWETAWWLSSARLASRHQKNYPGKYLIVCYEQLFSQPKQTMQEICEFIGETFHPQMLTHGEIEAHATEQPPPLGKQDLHFIHSHTQHLMKYFGYEYDNLQLSRLEWLLYGLMFPTNLAALLIGKISTQLGQRELIRTELSV